jgi:hypothetical protein
MGLDQTYAVAQENRAEADFAAAIPRWGRSSAVSSLSQEG